MRNRSETSSGGQVRSFPRPESGLRKAAWAQFLRAPRGAPQGSCDHTQLGTETYLPRPSRAGQVDLKPDCFNSALCPTTSSAGVSNCLLKEQMSLTWVSSPAGWLSSCMALGKLRSSLELFLCHPSKENSETSKGGSFNHLFQS